jgi:hypothetical protein
MKIEIMDEFEEYRMILQHYAIIVASKSEDQVNLESIMFKETK